MNKVICCVLYSLVCFSKQTCENGAILLCNYVSCVLIDKQDCCRRLAYIQTVIIRTIPYYPTLY